MKMPYRYRGVGYLVLLLIVLPWLAIRFSLRDTVAAWVECRRLRTQTQRALQAAPEPAVRMEFAKALLCGGDLLTLLHPVAEAQRVSLADYFPYISVHGEGLEVHTASVVLTGSYAGILHVVRHVEREIPSCRVSSLRFTTVAPPGRAAPHLEATVYIEQIVKTEK